LLRSYKPRNEGSGQPAYMSPTHSKQIRRLPRRKFISGLGYGSAAILSTKWPFGFSISDLLNPSVTSSSEWGFYNRQVIAPTSPSNHATILIHALDYTLTQESIANAEDLVIYADKITLRGQILSAGSNIFMHARLLIAESDSRLDVSGRDGAATKDYKPGFPAPAGQNPGENGIKGESGSRGEHGGSVTVFAGQIIGPITTISNGGKGGRGQDGGDGAQGTNGPPGPDGSQQTRGWFGGPGADGGQGGAPGPPGGGGDGGDAGAIQIAAIAYNASEAVFSMNGGIGGACGTPGKPGKGGTGGPGGRNYHCDVAGGREGHNEHYVNCRLGPDRNPYPGDLGPSPAPLKPCPSPTSVADLACNNSVGPGCPGQTSDPNSGKVISKVTADRIGQEASLTTVLMQMHRARLYYLSARNNDCFESLVWVESITREKPGTGIPAQLRSSRIAIPKLRPSSDEWELVRTQSLTLLAQLTNGLDFYGRPPDYVPLVSYQTYKSIISQLIQIAKDIEASYRMYFQENTQFGAKLEALEQSLQLSRRATDAVSWQTASTENLIAQTQAGVSRMLDTILQQQLQLQSTQEAFQQAVVRRNSQGGGCNFFKTLQIIASVVSVAVGAYQNAADLAEVVSGGADSRLKDALAKDGNKKSLLIAKLQEAGADIQSLGEAYTKIQKTLETSGPDSAKILVKQEDFEKTLEPYLDMPEAATLRDQMRAYVDTTQSRNRKILELDALRIKRELLVNEHQQREAEASRIATLKAEIQDPELAEYLCFVKGLYANAKQDLVRMLYEERRAWEYWALQSHPFNVVDQDIASLEQVHSSLLVNEVDVRNARTNSEQLLSNVVVVVSEKRMATAFPEFRKSGHLTFSITKNEPALKLPLAALTVKEVNILLPGVKTTNGNNLISLNLIHSGQSYFLTQTKEEVQFSHLPRPIPVIYPLQGEGTRTRIEDNVAGKQGDLALPSPYSVWSLVVDRSAGIDLTAVKEIQIVFSLYYLPLLK
jgi:hypothetical protein